MDSSGEGRIYIRYELPCVINVECFFMVAVHNTAFRNIVQNSKFILTIKKLFSLLSISILAPTTPTIHATVHDHSPPQGKVQKTISTGSFSSPGTR